MTWPLELREEVLDLDRPANHLERPIAALPVEVSDPETGSTS